MSATATLFCIIILLHITFLIYVSSHPFPLQGAWKIVIQTNDAGLWSRRNPVPHTGRS